MSPYILFCWFTPKGNWNKELEVIIYLKLVCKRGMNIMSTISKAIYKQIQKDVPRIEEHIKNPILGVGSSLILGTDNLWDELMIRYSVIFPDMISNVKGKMTSPMISDLSKMNEAYSYNLRLLKTGLLAYLLVNDVEKKSDKFISNDSVDLMHKKDEVQEDTKINEIIEESKLYMRSDDLGQKQIALEKIWDAFERIKTVYEEEGSKKEKIENLIDKVSYGSETNKNMLDNEFSELTRIGNVYEIRHFEKGKQEIPSDGFREYLYFRMLSLISFCIKESKDINL